MRSIRPGTPLRRHDVDTRGRPEVDDDARGVVQVVSREAVDDAVGAHLLRIVHQQRHSRAYTGLDDHVGNVRPVPPQHRPDLAQHRRDRRQRRDTRDGLHVGTEETAERQRELVRRHRRVRPHPALPRQPRVVTAAGEHAQHDVGVADVDGEQHQTETVSRVSAVSVRGEISPEPAGLSAGSVPTWTGRLSASTNTTFGAYSATSAGSRMP